LPTAWHVLVVLFSIGSNVFEVDVCAPFLCLQAEEVAAYLHNHGVQAFMDEKDIYVGPNKQPIPHCTSFDFQSAAREGSPKPEFDFTICLGGDGTLLHYGSLYNTEAEYIPPVMTLGLGTLGFISSMGESQTHRSRSELLPRCTSNRSHLHHTHRSFKLGALDPTRA